VVFSPDDLVVYASVHTLPGIIAFDANTFLSLGTMSGPELASKLAADSTGRYLFAGYSAYYSDFMGTLVFDTGGGSPSPTPTPTPTATPTPTPRIGRCATDIEASTDSTGTSCAAVKER
jgi:hypothetical protein